MIFFSLIFDFVPCDTLSRLPVTFWPHIKLIMSCRIVWRFLHLSAFGGTEHFNCYITLDVVNVRSTTSYVGANLEKILRRGTESQGVPYGREYPSPATRVPDRFAPPLPGNFWNFRYKVVGLRACWCIFSVNVNKKGHLSAGYWEAMFRGASAPCPSPSPHTYDEQDQPSNTRPIK